MQLIEIIQLALLIFIALGVIIFLFSYLGYRTNSRIKDFPKTSIEKRKEDIYASIVSDNLVKNPNPITQNKEVKQNPRFEIFNPNSYHKAGSESEKSHKKKSHSPKTLIIKKKS